MRANYKKLAEEYRKKHYYAEERIAGMFEVIRRQEESLRKKEEELDEWKARYVQVLNSLIDLQERVARKEG